MIDIQSHQAGAVLPVRAAPGSRASGIRGVHDKALKVCVTQAPEKGKANKALIAVLAKELGLRKSQVALLSGETTKDKQFLITEVTVEQLARMVQEKLADQ